MSNGSITDKPMSDEFISDVPMSGELVRDETIGTTKEAVRSQPVMPAVRRQTTRIDRQAATRASH